MENEIQTTIKLRKFKKLEVSPFFGQNLLYEYSLNILDEERRAAVEDCLSNDKNTQTEFIQISNGLQYVELLSEVVVSDKIIEQIENRNTQLNKILNKIKFHQWPLTLKWGIEASVVALAMALTLNILPWSKIVHLSTDVKDQDFIVAQIDKKKKDQYASDLKPNDNKPDFVDEEVKEAAKEPAKSSVKPTTPAPTTTVAATAQAKPSATPTPAPTVATAKPTTVATAAAVTIPPKTQEPVKATTGYLYRGQLLITNIEMSAPKITQKIAEFGGRKAGEVEIGWKKTSQIYYYHFTIPEAKMADLENFLKLYSDVKLKKETHPRVMPDGILRIIFTVEEKNPSSQEQK